MLIIVVTPSLGSEPAKWFVQGIEAYNASDYDGAITLFLKVAESDVQNSKLYYNLGNAYLKKDDVGHAILWYEKALKHSLHDPDLTFNYQYAKSLLKDEIGEKPSPVIPILFFWKYIFSQKTVQYAALCFNLLFWGFVILKLFYRTNFIRMGVYGLAILTFILSATAFYTYYESDHIRKGIVLPEKIAVRSGFDEHSTELFALHSGTKVRIQKEQKEHVKIYYSKGKMGWVKKSVIGFI